MMAQRFGLGVATVSGLSRIILLSVFSLCMDKALASAQTDWSQLSGDVTVPAGARWVAEDADMAAVNALTSITFADETGIVEFTGTSATAPTVPFIGNGTVLKSGPGAWVIAEAKQQGFIGTFALKGGSVSASVRSALVAGVDASIYGTIVVDGGALIFPKGNRDQNLYQHERISLKGSGVADTGALVIQEGSTNPSQMRYLSLAGDATIVCNSYFWPRGTVRLNGYVLTLAGTAADYVAYQSVQVAGPGEIRVKGDEKLRIYALRIGSTSTLEPFSVAANNEFTRLTLEDKTQLMFYVDEGKSDGSGVAGVYRNPVNLDLRVAEGANASVRPLHRYTTPVAADFAQMSFLASGAMTLADAAAQLTFYCTDTKNQNNEIHVAGPISGPGKICVGNAGAQVAGRVRFSNAANSWTGDTAAYLGPAGAFGLDVPGALPDFSKFTCSGGRVSLIQPAGDSPWTEDKVAQLANEATWTGSTAISFDTCARSADAKTVIWTGAHPITNAQVRLAAENGTTLLVTGTGAATNGFAAFGDAALKFTGDNPIHLSALDVNQLPGGMTGAAKIVFDGAKDVHLPSNCLAIGSSDLPARVTVKDSLLTVGDHESYVRDASSYSLNVARMSGEQAILEVQDNSVITSKLHLAEKSGSIGAVYQRGGSVVGCGWHSDNYVSQAIIGYAGHGYYELTGGRLTLLSRPSIAMGGVGILHIDGGDLDVTRHFIGTSTSWFFLGYDGHAEMYVKKGSAMIAGTSSDSDYVMGLYTADDFASLTLVTSEAQVKFPQTMQLGWSTGGGQFNMNLNGGVLEACPIGRRTNADASRTNNPDKVYVNFNGGTWKTRTGASSLFNAAPEVNFQIRVNVFEKGATVDCDYTKDPQITIPVRGATGQGVTEVALPAEIAEATFIAPPVIRIDAAEGDVTGSGATAYPIFDSKTGKVMGVEVTSHGCDYTAAPTARFLVGTTEMATAACTLGANVSGGFTKTGRRLLALYATNTWAGTTTVAGGTLYCGCDWAIPTNSAVVLKGGGILDFGHHTGEVARVSFGPGAGTFKNNENALVPAVSGVEISVAELLNGESVPFAANQSLDGFDVTIVGDLEELASSGKKRFTILSNTKDFTGAPTFVASDLPKGWEYCVTSKDVSLFRASGMKILLR
ncbi:MAG: autotransporter-associated beta strand repeat-containing protein [Kiritimatiellae bacterium]|nr:autotransporter-associated beta strand repeat-containing protein [Kiritimatiellia bacterium]